MDRDAFIKIIEQALEVARRVNGVLIGAIPAFPSISYGYIKLGAPISDSPNEIAFKIARFVEKPKIEDAKSFVESGEFLWNTGISVWRVGDLLKSYERLRPIEYAALLEISEASEDADAIGRILSDIPKTAIDRAIYERSDDLAAIKGEMGWSDIGSWDALAKVLAFDENANVVQCERTAMVDTEDCLIWGGGRLVAALGLRNLVIADAGDCILIADRDKAHLMKEIVNRLRENGFDAFL